MYKLVKKALLVGVVAPLSADLSTAGLKLLYVHSYGVGGLLLAISLGIFIYLLESLELKQ